MTGHILHVAPKLSTSIKEKKLLRAVEKEKGLHAICCNEIRYSSCVQVLYSIDSVLCSWLVPNLIV